MQPRDEVPVAVDPSSSHRRGAEDDFYLGTPTARFLEYLRPTPRTSFTRAAKKYGRHEQSLSSDVTLRLRLSKLIGKR